MTANDSSTGGILVPASYPDAPVTLYDDALDDFFQPILSGLSGITGSLVVPQWQPTMPNKPDITVDWMAFGITIHESPANAAVVHQSLAYDQKPGYRYDDGVDLYDETPQQSQRDVLATIEELKVQCIVYGPNSRGNAALISAGLQIAQNREPFQLAGIGYVSAGEIRTVPELINNLWHRRSDVILFFRRVVVRAYPVLDLVSAQGTVQVDNPPISRSFAASSS